MTLSCQESWAPRDWASLHSSRVRWNLVSGCKCCLIVKCDSGEQLLFESCSYACPSCGICFLFFHFWPIFPWGGKLCRTCMDCTGNLSFMCWPYCSRWLLLIQAAGQGRNRRLFSLTLTNCIGCRLLKDEEPLTEMVNEMYIFNIRILCLIFWKLFLKAIG